MKKEYIEETDVDSVDYNDSVTDDSTYIVD